MKKYTFSLFILLFFLFITISSHAQKIDWNDVREFYFKKYQPADTPAWIFPIVFEEGSGQRDTLYYGYDPHKKRNKFGNGWIKADTGKFHACFWGILADSVTKLWFDNSANGFYLEFYNGKLPLTMWWDSKTFYSDTLPFQDQSPAPRAEGTLSDNGGMLVEEVNYSSVLCSWQFPILITDTVKSEACYRKESVIYTKQSFNRGLWISSLSFSIGEWTGKWLEVQDNPKNIPFSIYPQPAADYIKVNTSIKEINRVRIISTTGQKLMDFEDYYPATNIDIGSIPSGIYIILIEINSKIFAYKFVKR